MKIRLKTYASLSYFDGLIDVEEGISVKELLKEIKLSADLVFIILINGKKSNLNSVLEEEDEVSLFPPIGGG